MRKLTIVLVPIAAMSVFAAETKMRVSDLPPAVQSALKQHLEGAKITGASSEREKGAMTYEVETTQAGKSRDLTFAADGSLIEVEREVDLASIPQAAQDAIQRRAAGGTIRKVESITRGSETSYEAAIKTKAGKNTEVAVNADGSPHKD